MVPYRVQASALLRRGAKQLAAAVFARESHSLNGAFPDTMRHMNNMLSRRQFLGVTALASAGALTRHASAAKTATAKLDLRVAFVGTGNRAHALLHECLQYGGNIVALCDVDQQQLAEPVKIIGEKNVKARLFSDFRRLLDDAASFDTVVVATPDHWHAPLCRAFMQAGKHVYCEKPLTRTVGEARALRELAGRSRVVTQLGNQSTRRRRPAAACSAATTGSSMLMSGAKAASSSCATSRASTACSPTRRRNRCRSRCCGQKTT